MSLLHQDYLDEIDDAALGESYTKGSSHVVWATLIAIVLVSAAIAVYVLAGEKPPVASGEIVQVWSHPHHVITPQFDANGASMAQKSFDEVLVFAHVKLRNQSKVPLYLEDVLANAKLGDGTLSVSAGSAAQYEEVFLAYPELAALRSNVFAPRITIDPGQSLDGTAFWVFRQTKQEWDARKDLNFTFIFQYQSNLVLAPHNAVMEQ